jgi:hypothetical protein
MRGKAARSGYGGSLYILRVIASYQDHLSSQPPRCPTYIIFPIHEYDKNRKSTQSCIAKNCQLRLSLKQKTELDIYFANNTYGGTETKIGLTADERRRHVYILGATGYGKIDHAFIDDRSRILKIIKV